jgi:hypothetical protein
MFACPTCGTKGQWGTGTRANGEYFRHCNGHRLVGGGESAVKVQCSFEWPESDDAKHGIATVSPLGRPCTLETLQALAGVVAETLRNIALDVDLFRLAPLTSREKFEDFAALVEKTDHEQHNLQLLRDQYLTHAQSEESAAVGS